MFILDIVYCILKILYRFGKTYKLQSRLLKHDLEHGEIFDETWEEKENEWLPYLKNNVISTAFA